MLSRNEADHGPRLGARIVRGQVQAHADVPHPVGQLRACDEQRQAIIQAADKAAHTRDLLARHGIECPNITGAGSGTFEFEGRAASMPNCSAAPTSS